MPVRIHFVGLNAFVPDDSGAVHALIVDVRDGRQLTTRRMEPHRPLLLASASRCEGARTDDDDIADWIFNQRRDRMRSELASRLHRAIRDGVVWDLAGDALSLDFGDGTPAGLQLYGEGRDTRDGWQGAIRDPQVRDSISWVARLERLVPGAVVRPELLAPVPPAGLIAARLKLDRGIIRTHKLVTFNAEVVPVQFRSVTDGSPAEVGPAPMAEWVTVDLPSAGPALAITATRFDGSGERRLRLEADDAEQMIELAIVNLCRKGYADPGDGIGIRTGDDCRVGHDFEAFYDLMRKPPADRWVPHVAEATTVPYERVAPGEAELSRLLPALGLAYPLFRHRAAYSEPLCPPGWLPC